MSMPADTRAILMLGDSLRLMPYMRADSVDAIITDPPYSSGGMTIVDRNADPIKKYVHTGTLIDRPTFFGDNRDARSWAFWCTLWLSECFRVARSGAYVLVFTDWRQLPATSDVLQAAGFTWRGIIAWNKGRGARAPHKGYVRHQCEFVVWGTKGPCLKREDAGPFDGCLSVSVRKADKHHLTGKPTDLMLDLVKLCPRDGIILDPFAGSGTTGVAAIKADRRFIGIELSPEYHAIAARRIAEAA